MRDFQDRSEALLIRFRWAVLAIFAVLTAVLGYYSYHTKTNNDFEAWLPEHDSVVKSYKEVEAKFSAHTVAVVLLDVGDAFSESSLETLQRVTQRLAEVKGVARTLSLTNAIDLRLEGETIHAGRLIERLRRRDQIDAVRRDVLTNDLYRGTLVSNDARYVTVVVSLDAEADDVAVAAELYKILDGMKLSAPYYLAGDPAYTHFSDVYIQKDMKGLVPYAIGAMVLVFWLGFKKLKWVPYPIVGALISIFWLYGLKTLTGGTINVLTPGVMLILLVTASDYSVYSVNYYRQQGTTKGIHRALGNPLFFSCLTTVAGLMSYTTTDIWVLKDFGYSVSIGLAIGFIVSLGFVPAIFGPKVIAPAPESNNVAGWTRVSEKVMRWCLGHRWSLLLASVAAGAIMIPQMRKLQTRTTISEILAPDSPPLKAGEILNKEFTGAYPVLFYIKGDLTDPITLRAMMRAENFLRNLPEVGGVVSPASLVGETRRLLTDSYGIPATGREAHAMYFFLEGDPYVESLVDPEHEHGLVLGYVRAVDTQQVGRLADVLADYLKSEMSEPWVEVDTRLLPGNMGPLVRNAAVRWIEQERLWLLRGPEPGYPETLKRLGALEREGAGTLFRVPRSVVEPILKGGGPVRMAGFEAIQTGYPILTKRLEQLLLSSQKQSIAIASIAVLILLTISVRSAKIALIGMVPVLFPLALALGLMGFLGIPIDFGTVLLGGITLGLGVDGAIHVLSSVKAKIGEGQPFDEAMIATTKTVGRSFFMATASTLAGFLILAFSEIKTASNLAVTCGLGISLVMLAVLFLLPALMPFVLKPRR
ncbi:MAG: MMPL family transporter [Nitrospirae bacterium]|nr:MMPL family transporter [Nitrospirota bacterium]